MSKNGVLVLSLRSTLYMTVLAGAHPPYQKLLPSAIQWGSMDPPFT